MNKFLILLILLTFTSCVSQDSELYKMFKLSQTGRTCFNVNTPDEFVGHYCIEKVK